MKTILDDCYSEARKILTDKRMFVDRIAGELLEVETISQERFIELMSTPTLSGEPALQPIYSNATSI